MRQLQVIPKNGSNLYGAMVEKEIELHKKNRGTFRRSAAKVKNRAKWSHSSYPGWIKMTRGMGEVVLIEVKEGRGRMAIAECDAGVSRPAFF